MLSRSTRIKCGIILILIGMCLPIVSIGFSSKYIPQFGIIRNIQRMEIVLRAEEKLIFSDEPSDLFSKSKIAVPYRYVFASGTLLVFVGLGLTVIASTKKEK
jgi:hypothetical protein